MPSLALCCLDNNLAAIKLDSGVTTGHSNAQLRALIHFHQRTIAQAQHGVTPYACAHLFTFAQLVTSLQRLLTAETYPKQDAVKRLHSCSHAGWPGEQLAGDKISGNRQQHYGGGRHCIAPTLIRGTGQRLRPRRSDRTNAAHFGFATAFHALVQVGGDKKLSGKAQFSTAVLHQKPAHIGAAMNRFTGGHSGTLAELLPDSLSGDLHQLPVRLICAHGGYGLFQHLLWFIFLALHRVPLAFTDLKSFFNRARVRCNTTATTAGDVFIRPAISRLLRSSTNRSTNISAHFGLIRASACRSQSRSSVTRAAVSRDTASIWCGSASSETVCASFRLRSRSSAAFTAERCRYPGRLLMAEMSS